MAKYKVYSYYQYVGISEVEADDAEEAFEKGYALNDKMTSEDLYYVDYIDSEVIDEDGGLHNF